MALSSICRSGRPLFVVALFLAMAFPTSAQEKPTPPRVTPKEAPRAIRLSQEQIPAAPASLSVLRLSAQKPPTEFVQEVLRRADPNAKKLAPLSEIPQLVGKEGRPPKEIVGALSGEHLAAYVDLRTGDAEIFPSFTGQKPVPAGQEGGHLERAQGLAR